MIAEAFDKSMNDKILAHFMTMVGANPDDFSSDYLDGVIAAAEVAARIVPKWEADLRQAERNRMMGQLIELAAEVPWFGKENRWYQDEAVRRVHWLKEVWHKVR